MVKAYGLHQERCIHNSYCQAEDVYRICASNERAIWRHVAADKLTHGKGVTGSQRDFRFWECRRCGARLPPSFLCLSHHLSPIIMSTWTYVFDLLSNLQRAAVYPVSYSAVAHSLLSWSRFTVPLMLFSPWSPSHTQYATLGASRLMSTTAGLYTLMLPLQCSA